MGSTRRHRAGQVWCALGDRPPGRATWARGAARAAALALGLGVVSLVAGVLPAGPAGASGSGSPTTVVVVHNKTWGPLLALANGRTIYRLVGDSKDKSVCSGTCLVAWPAVVLAKGQKVPVGHGIHGLGSFKRSTGARQVTYQGIPLYLYIGDHKAGQVNGNIKDTWGQWWTVNPTHPLAVPKAKSSTGHPSTNTSSGSGVAY